MRYKCPICKLHGFDTPICPDCGYQNVIKMCEADHKCTCSEDIKGGIKYCDICGEHVCPACGSHDVVVVSRVTGYLSDVGGWNNAKKQELKDRTRVTIE